MRIQWFPGHMHKARLDIRAALSRVDLVIELLDARIPFSSQNPMLAELRGNKPCVLALAKADLSDPRALSAWHAYFSRAEGVGVASTSITQPQSIRKLAALCRKTYADSGRSRQRLTMMVAGIPNVGKSALINALAGRAIAKTGNEPAVTRQPQQIELSPDWALMDTPGVLWPKVENPNSGFRLAATGAVRASAMSHIEVAAFLAEYLMIACPRNLIERFRLAGLPPDQHALLQAIGQQRGCLKSGGQVDLERAAKSFLADFRGGGLGKICLETPAMMQRELAELALLNAQKVDQKHTRQARRRQKKPAQKNNKASTAA